jgi:ribosomal protein S18 acetylase RimI-like enzyme
VACIAEWWLESRPPEEARLVPLLLPKVFLEHFAGTSWILERDSEITGFLVGFYSGDQEQEAYIHFVGTDPGQRKQGLARRLYTNFFEHAAAAGRTEVRCITSPQNTGSIAFHRAMGFSLEPGDREVDGIPVHTDYDGPGQDRVLFHRVLGEHG